MRFLCKINKAAAASFSILFTLLLAAQAGNRTCSKAGEYFDPGQQMCLRCPLPSSEILIHLHYLSTCRDHPVCCVANTTSGSTAVPSWKPPHSSSSSSSSCSSGTTTLSSPLQAQGMSTSWMVFGAAAPVLAIALIMLGVWKFSHKSQELPHGFRTGAEVGNATGEEDGNAAEITGGAPGSVTGSGFPEDRDGEASLQLLQTALEDRNRPVYADGDEDTTGTYETVFAVTS